MAVNDLDGRTTTFGYNDTIPHYLDEVIHPLGRLGQRVEYDEQGDLNVVDRGGTNVEFTHDVDSSIRAEEPARIETTYVYDNHGNLTTIIDALGGMASMSSTTFRTS